MSSHTDSWFGGLVWQSGQGAQTHLKGPPDQMFVLSAGDNRTIMITDAGARDLIAIYPNGPRLSLISTGQYGWSSGAPVAGGAIDTGFARSAAAVVDLTNGSTGSGSLGFREGSAPTAQANKALLYADDSGGKTRLMVLMPTGAAIQLAIEA